ncbi:MAG TPA: insulinase family protein [Kofleriaceae bacterium]|nr:insulinase family protein [Kofleriaceae bacterium]
MALAAPHAMAVSAPQVMRRVLPGGVRLVVMRDRSAPLVAARALWAGGLRLETPELAGIEHVVADAWTGGCGGLDGDALAAELRSDGATMAGVAGRDTLALQAEWTRAGWERGLELMADCVTHPWFAPDAVRGARERVRALLVERRESPTWAALDLLDGALRGPSALGTIASLEHIERAQVAEHYRAGYPLAAMTLAVVGDVDPARVLARAEARFGQAGRARADRARPASRPPALPPATQRELYRHLSGPRPAAAVAIGFPAVGRVHPDRAALEVAAALLGGTRAALVADAGGGYLAVHRVCRPEEVPATLAAMRAELDRLRDPGASEADVHEAAARLAREREAALGRAPLAAALLALYEALGPGAQHAQRHAALLRAVRAADVRAAVAHHLRADAAVVATAMPLLASPGAARRMREASRPPRETHEAARPDRKKKRARPARRRSHR